MWELSIFFTKSVKDCWHSQCTHYPYHGTSFPWIQRVRIIRHLPALVDQQLFSFVLVFTVQLPLLGCVPNSLFYLLSICWVRLVVSFSLLGHIVVPVFGGFLVNSHILVLMFLMWVHTHWLRHVCPGLEHQLDLLEFPLGHGSSSVLLGFSSSGLDVVSSCTPVF